jgi:hypothetical protein
MMITSYSNKLYVHDYFGVKVTNPEWLCTERYRGESIVKARAAIMPLDAGCTGIIREDGFITELHITTGPEKISMNNSGLICQSCQYCHLTALTAQNRRDQG